MSDGSAEQREQWFFEHYDQAANEAIDFLGSGGISLGGRVVVDIGCGEGITDLGLFRKAKPARLVGFDINPTSRERLSEETGSMGLDPQLPDELEFVVSEPERLPWADSQFDVAITWSAFEHIGNPVAVLREIRRVLKPEGAMFLQLWPFYHSQHGSHLMRWFPEGFAQMRFSDEEIFERMRNDTEVDGEWTEMMIEEYSGLNRITLDELQVEIRTAGFAIRRLEILSHTINIPEGVDEWPLAALGISGVKLLASPAEPRGQTTEPTGTAIRTNW